VSKSSNKLLKKEQKEKLQKLIDDILELADEVVKDYENKPSELSGSVIQVHEDSPYLATKEERLLGSKKDVSK
tara:strand:- start:878 stop:1096 length:219 start_codon:yes stop_codon:yes gene_type:complete